ncbi:MAG TPA: GTP-binding protein [Solirubrobacteraceae bacterium]|nr:GTP-binding protein [Solirubrobacteraceae bacterium]
MTESGRIPVTILGGFLGSGKTSLLRHMLTGAPDTAVIVNEFGAVSVDHKLLRSSEARVAIVGGGCACCTRREDLEETLVELLDAHDRGTARLSRVVIECSGLADPAPIVFTIAHHPMLRHHYYVERLIVTVDGYNGPGQLDAHPEVAKQILLADELVLTKLDLLGDDQPAEHLVSELAKLNPTARIRSALYGVVGDEELRPAAGAAARTADPDTPEISGHHTDDVRVLSVPADAPLDWLAFSIWLSMLLHARGEQVLRVKGLIELDDGTLASVNGVQHVMHMPEHITRAAIADPAGGIVFITRGLDVDRLKQSLDTFQRLADTGANIRPARASRPR